jgi:hypothetical protein
LLTITFEPGSKLACLEKSAFAWCRALSSLWIPARVKRIEADCFQDCGGLAAVTFEAGSELACIEDSAFAGCKSLSSIRIPSRAKVGQNSFAGCQGLSVTRGESGSGD